MKHTPHINPNGVKVAQDILLPGDPLRAKFIADTFLSDVVQFNSVRGMLGYTGNYQGREISVMGTGMGVPSMALYSWELINVFDVKRLIRVGTIGSLQDTISLYDVIIPMATSVNSSYTEQFNLQGTFSPTADFNLMNKLIRVADSKNVTKHVGSVLTSDIFYDVTSDALKNWSKIGILGVEMETAALFTNANYYGAQAASIMTVSDNIITGEKASTNEREATFTEMIEIALLSLLDD